MVASGSAAGCSDEALRGHRGLMKNSRGNGFNVSGIWGLLPYILCAKAQQP